MFFESALVQHLQAECTGEMLWVKFLAHGTDTTLLNRFLTRLAHLVLGNIVMVFTIWLTTVFKVVSFWKCHMTLLE